MNPWIHEIGLCHIDDRHIIVVFVVGNAIVMHHCGDFYQILSGIIGCNHKSIVYTALGNSLIAFSPILVLDQLQIIITRWSTWRRMLVAMIWSTHHRMLVIVRWSTHHRMLVIVRWLAWHRMLVIVRWLAWHRMVIITKCMFVEDDVGEICNRA